MKHFLLQERATQWNEDVRVAALNEFHILDTAPEQVLDGLAEIAGQICGTPFSLISLVDRERQWFKSKIGLDVCEMSRDIAICSHAILERGLFIVPDLTKDPRFAEYPSITGDPHLRFYAGAKLETDDGLPIGMLCVLDTKPHPAGLSADQERALASLAKAVMSHLKLRMSNVELVVMGKTSRTLTDSIPQMVWSARHDGHIDYCNTRWYAFMGLVPGSAGEHDWTASIHPDDQGRAAATWRQSVAAGQAFEAEYRLRHHTGAYKWVHAHALPSRKADGTVERWFGTLTDIHSGKRAEANLAASEERLRLAVETTSLGIWDCDLVAGHSTWSPEAREVLGVSLDVDVTPTMILEILHPDDRSEAEAGFVAASPSGTGSYHGELRIVRADSGDARWIAVSGRTLIDEHGQPVRKICTIQDITDRKLSEAALRASEERLRLALNVGRMVAWERNLTSGFVTCSGNAAELLGIGSSPYAEFLSRIDPEDRPAAERFIGRADATASDEIEFRYTTPDGRILWLGGRAETMAPDRCIGVTFDITDRKEAEREIWRSANHDPLTGLPNRILFQHQLDLALADAERTGERVGLLFLDLDKFKELNDTLGHDAGDAMLIEIGSRLKASTGGATIHARLGGDEFAVLLTGSRAAGNLYDLATHLRKALSRPFAYAGRTLSIHASVGSAVFPQDATRASDLMKNADIALYQAKSSGRSSTVTYSPAMRRAMEDRIRLIRDVREGVARDQFVPFYQPKVSLATGRINGLEALARWHHPIRGILSPAVFGAAFDDHELAIELGKQLLAKVVSDMREWLGAGREIGRVAFNLSSAECSQADLASRILTLLGARGVPTRHFEVEVTETVLLGSDTCSIKANLERLHDAGVQVALDDFGTGFASLTHLKQFPVDHIKIDRSFISDLDGNSHSEAIVAAVAGLAKSLEMMVTAEGVETSGQMARLRDLGCGFAQGNLFSYPVPASEAVCLFGKTLVPAAG